MAVTDTELETLASSHDILTLGMLADEVRRGLHGTRTTFVRVAVVSADPGAPILCPAAAGEVRVVGTPASLASAMARVGAVVGASAPIVVSAFSLADLEQLAKSEGVSLRSVLEDLRSAGAELVAEAPIDRLQDPVRAIEEVNIAGLTLARLTVERLHGADPVLQFKVVVELQRTVGVIRAFAPLARMANPAAPTTGFDDVKRVALARLIVDNIPSIQVDWSLYGPKLAQVALTVGADDVDGVSAEDEPTTAPRRAALAEIRRNIQAAGQEPVERDGRFDRMAR
jgi:aminodeoxyfutalosine synthase